MWLSMWLSHHSYPCPPLGKEPVIDHNGSHGQHHQFYYHWKERQLRASQWKPFGVNLKLIVRMTWQSAAAQDIQTLIRRLWRIMVGIHLNIPMWRGIKLRVGERGWSSTVMRGWGGDWGHYGQAQEQLQGKQWQVAENQVLGRALNSGSTLPQRPRRTHRSCSIQERVHK